MPDTLDDREKAELEARLREELLAEHERRLADLASRRQTARDAGSEHRAQRREEEIARFRSEIRQKFYAEMGYVRDVNSRGEESWLPREVAEARQRHRKRRSDSQREYRPGALLAGRHRILVFYGVLVVLAVAVGWFLVRS